MVGRGWPWSQKGGTAKADGVQVGYQCLIAWSHLVSRVVGVFYFLFGLSESTSHRRTPLGRTSDRYSGGSSSAMDLTRMVNVPSRPVMTAVNSIRAA